MGTKNGDRTSVFAKRITFPDNFYHKNVCESKRRVMRKLVDTFVLVCLLVGPALVLTCVRQSDVPEVEPISEQDELEEDAERYDIYAYTEESPRP